MLGPWPMSSGGFEMPWSLAMLLVLTIRPSIPLPMLIIIRIEGEKLKQSCQVFCYLCRALLMAGAPRQSIHSSNSTMAEVYVVPISRSNRRQALRNVEELCLNHVWDLLRLLCLRSTNRVFYRPASMARSEPLNTPASRSEMPKWFSSTS